MRAWIDDAKDVVNWYAELFVDQPNVAINIPDYIRRTSELHRTFRLTDEANPASRRYFYYQANLTHKSVPEMAKELGIPEGQVYREISLHDLSLKEVFVEKEKLSRARALIQQGKTTEAAAEELGISPRALEFALHHEGTLNRGVSWYRLVAFEGRLELEPVVLVRLQNRGLTHQEIADRLNLAAQTPIGHPKMRTAQSVAGKLEELGLSRINEQGPSEVMLPGYGVVKEDNELVPGSTKHFLFDHRGHPINWLSSQLGVTPSGLRDFIQRHDLNLARTERPASSSHAAAGLKGSDLAAGYRAQRRKGKGKGKVLSREERDQLYAYQWLLRNRSNPKSLAKLPDDIRAKVEEWARNHPR